MHHAWRNNTFEGVHFEEHDGGKQVTMEQIHRQRLAARRLIVSDADYAAAGVEVMPGTSGFLRRPR